MLHLGSSACVDDLPAWDPEKESRATTAAAAAAFDAAAGRCFGPAAGCACDLCYHSSDDDG
jgi:hypothetical protein